MFREDDGGELVADVDKHWVRMARKAGARGTYFFRTSPERQAVRPAVHVAEAQTVDEAKAIHARLWNQGINPFLIIVLPGQVRVYTGFAYDPSQPAVGEVVSFSEQADMLETVSEALSSFRAEAIDQAELWQVHSQHLRSDTRVDATLLAQLRRLSVTLQDTYGLNHRTSHGLIGKSVYLSYLRARDILSDKWLKNEAGVEPSEVFDGASFHSSLTLTNFRKLSKAVEKRFNGKLFPIAWGSRYAPRADAIQLIGRIFSGEELSGQLHLPFRAYDFSYIPIEFLSSVYEQFLHEESSEDQDRAQASTSDPEKRGAHYTPEPLADYLVSEVQSVRRIESGMKILDPCCGSGVFLVIAYRRLVELECQRQDRDSLNPKELKDLLESSIYAVERNPVACQIAGFSLILTMLSYVNPPELHRWQNFKFPSLLGSNLFSEDFFDPSAAFWKACSEEAATPLRFDWILGNPPWVELDKEDPKAAHLLNWSQEHIAEYGLARARTGEAFAWKVMDCLADKGVVGLVLHAKTLTNDHLTSWRKRFFRGVSVRRITNFANLAYVIFPSAQQPAFTVIYSKNELMHRQSGIDHYGPFVANLAITPNANPGVRKVKKQAWAIGFSESEITNVSTKEAVLGEAVTWKMALWGNRRDTITLERLRRLFTTTLGALAKERSWTLALGLQLRSCKGAATAPNEYTKELEEVPLLNHKALIANGPCLTVPDTNIGKNTVGCYVRKRGGMAGLGIIKGPHLFLWNDFAAYSKTDFIIQHDKLGLAGGSMQELKAVATIWNSRFASYLLFISSASWGIGVSQIDKGDASMLPFPALSPDIERALAEAWNDAVKLEADGAPFEQIKDLLDARVADALGLPLSVTLVVKEFFQFRYQLNKGKSPPELRKAPDIECLRRYATTLRDELDNYLGGKAKHAVIVRHSPSGIGVSVKLTKRPRVSAPEVREATGKDATLLNSLLTAAEEQFSQWVYVKRSVRIFDGDTIHLIKTPRRLEWTQTQAMLDADDIIAEVLEAQSKAAS